MPVTIAPVVAQPTEEVYDPELTPGLLDINGRVTFAQYTAALVAMQAELCRILLYQGWDHPSEVIRKISLEFGERRNYKPKPAKFGGEDVTEDMMTPEGWAKFTERAEQQYAQRLTLFRKRILSMSVAGYFGLDQVNEVFKAANLPEYPKPKGFKYQIGGGPRLTFISERGATETREEVQRLHTEFYAANGWEIVRGYSVPSVDKTRDQVTIPAEDQAELL